MNARRWWSRPGVSPEPAMRREYLLAEARKRRPELVAALRDPVAARISADEAMDRAARRIGIAWASAIAILIAVAIGIFGAGCGETVEPPGVPACPAAPLIARYAQCGTLDADGRQFGLCQYADGALVERACIWSAAGEPVHCVAVCQ